MPRRRLISPVVLIGIALAALGVSPTAAQAVVADASCPGPRDDAITVNTDERLAQTFIPVHTGSLVQAQIEIIKSGPGGDFLLQLYGASPVDGYPTGAISSAKIPDSSVPTGTTTLVGNFSPGALMLAGQLHALVVTRPGGPAFDVGNRSGDPCPGQAYRSPTQAGPTFSLLTGSDLVFQLTVNPSNLFSIDAVQGRRLILTVPEPGSITVVDARSRTRREATAAARTVLLKRSTSTASSAGTATVRLRLTKRAKRLLRENRRLDVKPAVTFTPTAGDPRTFSPSVRIRPGNKPGSFVKR